MNDTVQDPQSVQPQSSLSKLGQFFTGKTSVQDDTQQKLDTLESVLDEIQQTVPHGVVQAVDQATDTLNPQSGVGTAKEKTEKTSALDSQVMDFGGGLQSIEVEKTPEIPLEVESFLQRVEDHQATAPTEVVIADGTTEVSTTQYPSQPVIVLPITQAEEKEGAKKSPKFSFRWLVEFSHKIIRMFSGKVVYKQEET
jgi:hypothetical protein